MQILIPMAGAGSRFVEAGFKNPKPLIDVLGYPMIRSVINNLGVYHDYTFIVQQSVLDHYRTQLEIATSICKSSKFLTVEKLTQGAAETCLLAKKYLNPDKSLMIANCDQIMEWDNKEFYKWFEITPCDGTILTFTSSSNKNSYVKVDSNGWVTEAREKIVISNLATTGVYIWRKSIDFVTAAEDMISKNIRYNNEFYVCPVYNQNIQAGKLINTFHVEKHWPIGTPEDLNLFLEKY